MAYNLEPRTIKENLLGLIGNNPYAEPRPAKTREECFLSDIAENGGGGSLPEVTSEDNGDVLSVVNGAWDKAAPAGGGALIVKATGEATYTPASGGDPWEITVGVDKTSAEIEACFVPTTAKPVYIFLPYFSDRSPYYSYETASAMVLVSGRFGVQTNADINAIIGVDAAAFDVDSATITVQGAIIG